MQNTITRRTALAASVTLPLLPVSAYATPVEADPAVAAYSEWQDRFRALLAALHSNMDDRCPEFRAIDDAEFVAGQAVAEAVATTTEGLTAQTRFAFHTFGEVSRDDDWQDLNAYKPESFNGDGKRLLLSMLAGVEHIAEVAS